MLNKMWYFFYYTNTNASVIILQNKIWDKAPLEETFDYFSKATSRSHIAIILLKLSLIPIILKITIYQVL